MKTFTYIAVLASAGVAFGVAVPGDKWSTTSTEQPSSTSSASTSTSTSTVNNTSGQCSGIQQPACCPQDSLLGLDCTLSVLLASCNGVEACCDVDQSGLINVGAVCVQL